MQEQRTMLTEEGCLGNRRHEMQLSPVKRDPLYEKAFYSQEEDWTCEYALNTTAWE